MATLQQTLRGLPKADDQLSRGPGGSLQRAPTLKQAATQAGVAAAPTTPMGAQMLGASAQSAKMAGTPQQLQAALQQSTQSPTLETALRTQQFGRQATTAEQAAMTKSADMQKLGGLGDRVTNLINAQKAAKFGAGDTEAEAKAQQAAQDLTTTGTFEGKPISGVKNKLMALRTTPQGTPEYNKLLLEVNKHFGRNVEGKSPLSATELESLFKSAEQTVLGAVGEFKEPTVADLTQDTSFGYTAEQMSSLLGVPADQLSKYTVNQLSELIDNVTATEFGQVEQTAAQAGSVYAGEAERELARQAGKELAAIGITATEADMQNLNTEVARGTVITINGKPMTVEQAFADDVISDTIKQYLDAPIGSATRAEIEKNEPELTKFVQSHEAALTAAVKVMTEGTASFQQVQDYNKNLQTSLFGGMALDADLMKTLSPGWGSMSDTKIDTSKIPIFKYASTLSKDQAQALANSLNEAKKAIPGIGKELAGLTEEEITKLGIGTPGSNWDRFTKYNETRNKVSSIDPADTDSLIRETFDDVGSWDAAEERITMGKALTALGLESGMSITDLNKDKLKEALLTGFPSITLKTAATGGVPAGGKKTLGKPKMPTSGSITDSILNKLMSVIEDGDLTAKEINAEDGAISKFNLDELIALEKLGAGGNSKMDTAAVTQKRQQATDAATAQLIKENTSDNVIGSFTSLVNALGTNTDPKKANPDILKNAIKNKAMEEINGSSKYKHRYMGGMFKQLKSLGLLTPEFIQSYNNELARYRSINWQNNILLQNMEKDFGGAWGVDNDGNPLPPPEKKKVRMRKGDTIIEVAEGEENERTYRAEGWKRV